MSARPRVLHPGWFLLVALAFGAALAVADAQSAAAAPGASAARKPAKLKPTVGAVESVTATANSVRVTGWVLTPKAKTGLGVAVSVDRTWRLAGASGYRADIGRRYRAAGPNHGFDVTLPADPGPRFICVLAGGKGVKLAFLGCRLVNVGSPPTGTIEGATQSAEGRIRVWGWAVDPDTSRAVTTRITVDGTRVATPTANATRADLLALFPNLGAQHGFEAEVSVSNGTHTVCAEAVDVGGSTTSSLGCRSVSVGPVNPYGSIDAVYAVAGGVRVVGWVHDPDGSQSSTLSVAATRSGYQDPVSVSVVANTSRGDLPAVGVPADRGFDVTLTDIEAGDRTVCVGALNANVGADVLIGCRSVTVVDHRPIVGLDAATATSSGLTVSGWALDPDSTSSLSVTLRVGSNSTTTLATSSRADIGAAYPAWGANRGYSVSLSGLSAGVHEWCLTVTDVGSGAGLVGDREFCHSAVIGSSPLASGGIPLDVSAIGPSSSSAISGVDRDGGVSAVLRDGSSLWLFGDSIMFNSDGSLRSLVSNSAAWATAASPRVTRDGSSGSSPIEFVTPTAAFSCGSGSRAALWPMSTAVEPLGGLDRVYVYMSKVCVSAAGYAAQGVALVHWDYNPSDPPDGRAVQGTIDDATMFDDVNTAEAAVAPGDGYVYVYGCDGPDNGGWPTEYGPCTVARTLLTSASDASTYRWWNGSAWSATSAAGAAALPMPNGPDGVTNLPPAAFTVVYDSSSGKYLMGYSPWPGFTNQMAFRVASSPAGPWSAPVIVELPGCPEMVGGTWYYCYGASLQPALSTGGRIGVAYFDQVVAVNPRRGSIMGAIFQLAF